MTSTHDTIIAKVTTPHVFRHTPFEHETTTAVLVNTYTAIKPVNVAVVQNLDHNVRLIPVERFCSLKCTLEHVLVEQKLSKE